MSCGTPVITTRTSNLENYIDNGKNGFFVNIDDGHSFIDELRYILELSPTQREDMKQNCVSGVRFLYKNHTDSMRTLMENVNPYTNIFRKEEIV
jgi:glycosyltransferase involved in cell wall biosynthesis